MHIPRGHERHQTLLEVGHVGDIGDAQALALQDAESRLDLVHPRAVDGWDMDLEARMCGQPRLDRTAVVPRPGVPDQVDRGHARGNLLVEALQESADRDRACAPRGVGVDVAAARVDARAQGERAAAPVLMFHPYRLPPTGRAGGGQAGAWVQGRVRVDTDDRLPGRERARVKGDERARGRRRARRAAPCARARGGGARACAWGAPRHDAPSRRRGRPPVPPRPRGAPVPHRPTGTARGRGRRAVRRPSSPQAPPPQAHRGRYDHFAALTGAHAP